MKRYWGIAFGLTCTFLVLFVAAEAWHLEYLSDPSEKLSVPGLPSALLGVALLAADALLPVPSSLVMVAHGALFGVVPGALLSVVGRTAFTMIGFALGRAGSPLVARVISDQERDRSEEMLRRWGALAIVISRPVPLVAETVAVLAGASKMGWGKATAAAIVGALPEAVVYAVTGALAADFPTIAVVFVAILLTVVIFRLLSARWAPEVFRDS